MQANTNQLRLQMLLRLDRLRDTDAGPLVDEWLRAHAEPRPPSDAGVAAPTQDSVWFVEAWVPGAPELAVSARPAHEDDEELHVDLDAVASARLTIRGPGSSDRTIDVAVDSGLTPVAHVDIELGSEEEAAQWVSDWPRIRQDLIFGNPWIVLSEMSALIRRLELRRDGAHARGDVSIAMTEALRVLRVVSRTDGLASATEHRAGPPLRLR